jgi:hypothetical protein
LRFKNTLKNNNWNGKSPTSNKVNHYETDLNSLSEELEVHLRPRLQQRHLAQDVVHVFGRELAGRRSRPTRTGSGGQVGRDPAGRGRLAHAIDLVGQVPLSPELLHDLRQKNRIYVFSFFWVSDHF